MRTEKGELKQGKYYKRVSGEERSEVQTKKGFCILQKPVTCPGIEPGFTP